VDTLAVDRADDPESPIQSICVREMHLQGEVLMAFADAGVMEAAVEYPAAVLAALSLYFARAALDLYFVLAALDLHFVLALGTALALGLLAALVPADPAVLALCADLALGLRLDLREAMKLGLRAAALPLRADTGALLAMGASLAQGDSGALAPGAIASLREEKAVAGWHRPS
jgi:hypothetical protein